MNGRTPVRECSLVRLAAGPAPDRYRSLRRNCPGWAGATSELVLVRTAGQLLRSAGAMEGVVVRSTVQGVGAGPTGESVVAGTTLPRVLVLPFPASTLSLPPPASMVSLPSPPQMMSLPRPGRVLSLPPRPAITFTPSGAGRASLPEVPTMVAFSPPHCAWAHRRGGVGGVGRSPL